MQIIYKMYVAINFNKLIIEAKSGPQEIIKLSSLTQRNMFCIRSPFLHLCYYKENWIHCSQHKGHGVTQTPPFPCLSIKHFLYLGVAVTPIQSDCPPIHLKAGFVTSSNKKI